MPLNRGADYFEQIALGNELNQTYVYKFGRNPSVSTEETLIAGGGVYGLPTTAETVTVTSDSGNDVFPAGTGARTVTIFGLDADYNSVSETVNLGETSINAYIRVFRAIVATAGTLTPVGGANEGTITIQQSTSLINMCLISPNDGQTLVACFTVPAGHTALIWSADTTTGEGKNATNRLKAKPFNSDQPFQTKGIRDNFQNVVGVKFKIPGVYTEKTDIVFTSVSSAAGTSVSGTFLLQLIKNGANE